MKVQRRMIPIHGLAAVTLLAAGAPGQGAGQPPAAGTWQPLFDGTTTAAWRGYGSDAMPEGWRIVDGMLTKDGVVGDLVTRSTFRNFELELEWKIGRAGNSGVFYRGTFEYDHIYWSAPEYQLLDDANAPDGRNRLTAAGAVYGLYAAEYEFRSPDWTARVAASKFSRYPHYGLADRGMIGIQGDHAGTLALRNIRLRTLP